MTRRWVNLSVTVIVLFVFVFMAIEFARVQSVWTDEATQLSGLSLPFQTQLLWLIGSENPIPGVPPDRMPPLSYWLGSLWGKFFGTTELSFRIMGIGAVLTASLPIWLSARQLSGGSWFAPSIAIALIYLSPGVLPTSVEIRAYPFFFAFSSWTIWAFIRVLDRQDARRIATFSLLCLLTIYTHFFGLVMAGIFWLTLLLARGRTAGLMIFLGGLATLLLSSGLYPFVSAAVGVTGAIEPPSLSINDVIRDAVRLGFRLLFHGVQLQDVAFLCLGLACAAGLTVMAILRRHEQSYWLLLAVALAFTLLSILKIFISGFDVTAPHYNLWLVPTFVLALSATFGPGRQTFVPSGKVQKTSLVLVGGLLLSYMVADFRFMRNPDLYTHGPGDWVAQTIPDPTSAVVVHDGNGDWAAAYFALYYTTQGQLAQILREPGQPDRLLSAGKAPEAVSSTYIDAFSKIVFLRSASRTSSDLAVLADQPGNCGIAPMIEGLPASSRCAFYSATMQVIDKKD